ncbi:MAG: hypothetical protein GYB53_22120 [Rhodobacteraceae bacterium]|nr:hypothetical protein [Paracoccaceae bacterium]MBR9823273.1 hypothetical protein [Paracoccaceae bacterium]
MSNLEDLQGRILAAMDRIGDGLEGLVPAPAPGESAAELRQQLDEERTANAQLEERVKALHRRQEELEAALDAAQGTPTGPDPEVTRAMAGMEEALARLRAVNTRLRENNRLLREAGAGGADAEAVNESMAAELEALRADHAAAGAEAETILTALSALVDAPGEVSQATETEGNS